MLFVAVSDGVIVAVGVAVLFVGSLVVGAIKSYFFELGKRAMGEGRWDSPTTSDPSVDADQGFGASRYCTRCGAEYRSRSSFCTDCGRQRT